MRINFFKFFLVASLLLPCAALAEDIHLKNSESPYYFENKIIISPGLIKIDRGVEIGFGKNGGICFSNGECLKGDWIFKNGVVDSSMTFDDEILVRVTPSPSELIFESSLFGQDAANVRKTKKVPVSLVSLNGKDLNSTCRMVAEAYHFSVELPKSSVDIAVTGDSSTSSGYVAPDDVAVDRDFSQSKKGLIFIEVERKGEAWYVNPVDLKRYYLGRPADAFNIMKRLGLGVRHSLMEGGVFPDRLKGRILIDVDDLGKAYYIDPATKKARYLGRPEDAFKLMREVGVGVIEADIKKIEIGRI